MSNSYRHRLIITHRCNTTCPHCFNIDDRTILKDMDYDLLEKYLEGVKDYIKDDNVAIMGGEPTIHERFADIIELVSKYFNRCTIFTNGINDTVFFENPIFMKLIKDLRLRIVFNGFKFQEKKWLKYFINGEAFDGLRMLPIRIHIVVNERNFISNLNKIERIVNTYPRGFYMFSLSSDVSHNVFDENKRKEYQELWISFNKRFREIYKFNDHVVNTDHPYPTCFISDDISVNCNETDIRCGERCGAVFGDHGLIDPDFGIYHCNQFRYYLGNIYEKGEIPLTYHEVLEKLNYGTKMKVELLKSKVEKCNNCPVVEFCKGGCFVNQLLK